jgi:type IV pilus assembly protein PilQ
MTKKTFCCVCLILFLLMPLTVVSGASSTADSSFVLPQYSKRISLDLKDADVKDVLKVFSQQIGSNFIIADKVKDKKITVFLDKVPVEEGLSKILLANGLVYKFDQGSNIFIVDLKDETQKLLTRVYPLKYATVPSSKVLSTFAISDDSSSSLSTSSSSSDTGSSSSSSSGLSSGGQGGIVDSMNAVLSKSGKIAVDERTNSLIITDVEENFLSIEQTIAKLDVSIPQVLIQVEMVDVSKEAIETLGVKLGDNRVGITGIKANDYFHNFFAGLTGAEVGINAMGTNLSYSSLGMSGVMEFLSTRTDAKVLARPRILTMDNQTAQIKISSNEVVGVTRTSASADAGAAVTETAERMETGVILTVTPQVNLLSGDIMMAVSPKVIDVKKSTLGDFMDPETRGAKVMMRVHDGETIVLGGLLRTNKETTVTKVPVLGDIPLVGRLFRHKAQTQKNRELIIFITPHILSGNGVGSGAGAGLADISSRESSFSGRSEEINSDLDRLSIRKDLR